MPAKTAISTFPKELILKILGTYLELETLQRQALAQTPRAFGGLLISPKPI